MRKRPFPSRPASPSSSSFDEPPSVEREPQSDARRNPETVRQRHHARGIVDQKRREQRPAASPERASNQVRSGAWRSGDRRNSVRPADVIDPQRHFGRFPMSHRTAEPSFDTAERAVEHLGSVASAEGIADACSREAAQSG